jgi:hypothetical protein
VLGRRDAEEEGAVDAKTEMGKDKRFFPTLPLPEASSIPLFESEGSAICDQQYELFLRGEVSPFKDSTVIHDLTN